MESSRFQFLKTVISIKYKYKNKVMYKKFIFSIAILILVSCGQKEVDISQVSTRNGLVYQVNENDPFTGIVIKKLDNEQILISGSYKDGQKNGIWTEYFRNGQIEKQEEYNNGVYNGVVEKYIENGTKLSHEYYKNNELDGKCEYFSNNGILIKSAIYSNNILNGEFIENYENGNPKIITNYNNNQITSNFTSFYENGNKELEYTINDGHYVGDYFHYNTDGLTRKHYFYSNDIKINKGKWTIYYDNNWNEVNQPSKYYRIVNFDSNGKPVGNIIDYFQKDNSKQMEGHYLSIEPDIKEGKHTWYYENGNIKLEGNFINNEKDEIWILYYKDNNMAGNKICQKVEYKNGILNGKFEWFNIMHINISDNYELKHLIDYKYDQKFYSGMINSTGNAGKWWKVEGQLVNGKFDGEFKIWDRNWGTHSQPKNRYKKNIWDNGKMTWNGEGKYGGEQYFNPDGTPN